MNTNKGEGNTEIPEVEELVIEDGDDAETIKQKTSEHNQKVKDWRTKVDETNKQLFARTKKAEGFELVDGKWVKPSDKSKEGQEGASKNSETGLTPTDVFTLIKAGVSEEDISDIAEYAKFRKITIAEALQSDVVKNILSAKAEQRRVAEGTNTGSNKRGSSKLSDDALLSNAKKGTLPESDEDIARLVAINLKKSRK